MTSRRQRTPDCTDLPSATRFRSDASFAAVLSPRSSYAHPNYIAITLLVFWPVPSFPFIHATSHALQ